jgi:hypothetical protein
MLPLTFKALAAVLGVELVVMAYSLQKERFDFSMATKSVLYV